MRTSFRVSALGRMAHGAVYGAVAGVLFWLLWRRGLPVSAWQFERLPAAVRTVVRHLVPSAVAGGVAGALYGALLPRVYQFAGALAATAGTFMLFTALVQVLAAGFAFDGLFVSSLVVAMAIGLPLGVLARDGVVRLAPDLEPLERRTGSLLWSLAGALQGWPLIGPPVRRHRRARLDRQPFPAEWLAVLEAHVPVYARLPRSDQEALQHRVMLFLAEKRIEGRGLIVNDAVRVTIAAQACLLTLRLEDAGEDCYARLRTILVYPRTRSRPRRPLAVVFAPRHAPQTRMLLSWQAVSEGAADPDDGDNAVLHEFAHQLDAENGLADGEPSLKTPSAHTEWVKVLLEEYEDLCRALAAGDTTVIGARGAASAAEFFAVATETFFERPRELRAERPVLYRQLQAFYRQDPAAYVGAPAPIA